MSIRKMPLVNPDNVTTQQAVEWYLKQLEDNLSEQEQLEFQWWLAENEVHQKTYDDVEHTWSNLSRIESNLPWPSPEEQAADTGDGSEPLQYSKGKKVESALSPATGQFTSAINAGLISILRELFGRSSVAYSLAATAAIALFILLFNFVYVPATPDTYEHMLTTDIGENRQLDLPDGSTILLGASSAFEVSYTSTSRHVILDHGEALFTVAKDAARPFTVKAGNGFIRAVGTAFDVHIDRSEVSVTVLDGLVEVVTGNVDTAIGQDIIFNGSDIVNMQRVQLSQSQQIIYDSSGKLGEITNASDLVTVISWVEGKLVFSNRPLGKVIVDINRHSHTKISIADEKVKQMLFSGTFYQGRMADWLQAIQYAFPIRIVELEDKAILFVINESTE